MPWTPSPVGPLRHRGIFEGLVDLTPLRSMEVGGEDGGYTYTLQAVFPDRKIDVFQNTDQWWRLVLLPCPSGKGQALNSQSNCKPFGLT